MDEEREAPLDDLEAVEEAGDDLGDAGYTNSCGGSIRTGNT